MSVRFTVSDHSPPVEGCQAPPDGVVVSCLYDLRCRTIPLLWRGVRRKHFVMYAFDNHVKVLDNVSPIDLLVQSAVLSDGVVFCVPTIFTPTSTACTSNLR